MTWQALARRGLQRSAPCLWELRRTYTGLKYLMSIMFPWRSFLKTAFTLVPILNLSQEVANRSIGAVEPYQPIRERRGS